MNVKLLGLAITGTLIAGVAIASVRPTQFFNRNSRQVDNAYAQATNEYSILTHLIAYIQKQQTRNF